MHERAHRTMVFDRRRNRLADAIGSMLPLDSTVLDIGCGNGEIGATLAEGRQHVVGVETLRRSSCAIPFAVYDGTTLPFAADTFDWTVLVDVLHHTPDPTSLIGEALRVSSAGVIIKDHYARTRREHLTLAIMDWVGNRQFGVGRDGAYLAPDEWATIFEQHSLDVTAVEESIGLYPAVVRVVFEHGLHFVARLEPRLTPSSTRTSPGGAPTPGTSPSRP